MKLLIRTATLLMAFAFILTSTTQAQNAPADQAEFERLVAGMQIEAAVGSTMTTLQFPNPGRILEISEEGNFLGNYQYTNTGDNTGMLTYTYDASGNNAAMEQTEGTLTFTSATMGTFESTYFYVTASEPRVMSSGTFEIVDAEPPAVFAPLDQAEFERLVAGMQIEGIDARGSMGTLQFPNPGRILEIVEEGNFFGDYQYTNTGDNTGMLTYTYDASGNNAAMEQTEGTLTFTSATMGTFESTYFYVTASEPRVMSSGTFEIVDAEPPAVFAPLDQAEFERLVAGMQIEAAVGSTMTTLRFPDSGRILEISEEGNFLGNYQYTNTGDNTGMLTYTYDASGNNAAMEQTEGTLTFTSATMGTFESTYFYVTASEPRVMSSGTFEIVDAEPPAGFAPQDQAEFERLVAGMQIEGIDARGSMGTLQFPNPGRILEIEEEGIFLGNYQYTNTGGNTGMLTYTYDATGNNAAMEQTETILTFTSATMGTFESTYFYVEASETPEVNTGTFEIVAAPVAPATQAEFERLVTGMQIEAAVGSTMTTLRFPDSGRILEISEEGNFLGNYQYTNTTAVSTSVGSLTYTYDASGNDPAMEYVTVNLVFTSATMGAFESTYFYVEASEPRVMSSGTFEIVPIPGSSGGGGGSGSAGLWLLLLLLASVVGNRCAPVIFRTGSS